MINTKSKSRIERRAANRMAQHLKNLKDDPLKFWRDGQKIVTRADKTIAERRVASLLIPYEFAQIAKRNRSVLSSFLNCGFFKGQTPKEEDLLPRSIEWHFGCQIQKGPLYDRCWTYARAMQDAFKRDMPAEDVKKLLHRNIEKLSRSKTIEDAEPDDISLSDDSPADEGTPPDRGDRPEGSDTKLSGDEGNSPVPSKKPASPSTLRSTTPTRSKSKVFDPSRDIVIRAEPDEIGVIESLGVGAEGRINFVVSGISNDGWTDLTVTKLKYK